MEETPEIPVLLLHGALRGRLGLVPTMVYLQQHGFNAKPFGYATRRESLEKHADRLEAFVEDWLGDQAPVPMLAILTHSMGGLVARTYLGRESSHRHAERVRLVMMAPPNQGAQLANQLQDWPVYRFVFGAAADELHPERVSKIPLPPDHCEVCILAGGRGVDAGINPRLSGDDDGVVSFEETRLPGVEPILVGGVHSFLQWRPTVLHRAMSFFRDGPDAEIHGKLAQTIAAEEE